MLQAGGNRSSFYRRMKVAELKLHATQHWQNRQVLLEIVDELRHRSTRASLKLRDEIIERIVEISAEAGSPAPTTGDLRRRTTTTQPPVAVPSPPDPDVFNDSVEIRKPVPEPESEPRRDTVPEAAEQPTVEIPQPLKCSSVQAVPVHSESSGGWFWGSIAVLLIAGILWISGKGANRGSGVTDTFKKTVLENGDVHVDGYFRQSGTFVAPHARTLQNGIKADNFSTKGNVNFYTDEPGTK
jgi:hypothetical protein